MDVSSILKVARRVRLHTTAVVRGGSVDSEIEHDRSLAACLSVGTVAADHGPQRLAEDEQVLGDRPVVDVKEVEANGLAPRQRGAAGHLPQPGHAGTDE